jgi:hypothetical protein
MFLLKIKVDGLVYVVFLGASVNEALIQLIKTLATPSFQHQGIIS